MAILPYDLVRVMNQCQDLLVYPFSLLDMMRMGPVYVLSNLGFTLQWTMMTELNFLYYTDRSGTFWQCNAKAIGSGSEGADSSLQEQYNKVYFSVNLCHITG